MIKAFVREMKEAMLFRTKNLDLYDKNITFMKYIIVINIALGIALNMVILVIIILGSLLVINHEDAGLTAGQLTEYLGYFFTLIWPTMALSQFINIQSQAKASAERITKFLDHPLDVSDAPDAVEVPNLRGALKVEHLTFKYPDGDSPVLHDVSFDIKAGEMVGILGRTGSGKSSLVDLFLRIYNLEPGMIYLDGHDIMK
ncbi:MAG: ABC transporter ATP-binding protein/permease, partial [Acholeplasmataceae bacterium]|nr:ABC transporter ATP-binding protein/permease [Acholeplasmataceae bacterium]